MELLDRINGLLCDGESFCVATVLESPFPDVSPGAKVIVRPDGSVEFSTGSAAVDELIVRTAVPLSRDRRKRTVEVSPGFPVFFDFPAQEFRVVICGAGHIALPLARYALDAGFLVTVVDDREDYANAARFPGCDVIADDFVPALRGISYGPTTYVVVITRGHEHDAECLSEVLRHEAGYVGLIGSRRRVGFVLETLGKSGMPKEKLSNVFTPIGLPIGGESPEEIALSIAAELVCVRNVGLARAMAMRSPLGE